MQVGVAVGTTNSTVKHSSLLGWKLLVVQFYAADGRTPDGEPVIAVDSLGAGMGQKLILSSDGKGTRALLQSETTPVRWSVIGIQD
ncbi:MAG: EutN/CcmL family microcompartment protein [Planctomycetia bacterium]|nr:EutN/CcmL family microcompartment protein [Planctomycetia bacterium]